MGVPICRCVLAELVSPVGRNQRHGEQEDHASRAYDSDQDEGKSMRQDVQCVPGVPIRMLTTAQLSRVCPCRAPKLGQSEQDPNPLTESHVATIAVRTISPSLRSIRLAHVHRLSACMAFNGTYATTV